MLQHIYPGFTLTQFFESTAIPIPYCQSKNIYDKFDSGIVEFNYNSYGYRTTEFNKEINNYIVISGCSLTEGHGLHLEQTWGNKLKEQLNIPVVNLAKGGANAEFVSQNLINWINSKFTKPTAIIAQWPSPYRVTHWNRKLAQFVLNQNSDDLYNLKVKQGDESFYLPWITNIVRLDSVCRLANIPVLHLCLEALEVVNPALNILKQYDIHLHLDLKEPELTWHFDSSALDNMHHSEWCNEQWVKRILTLLKSVL
jgi:hypothetical protein